MQSHIKLKNVSFAYDGDKNLFTDLNIEVNEGETVGLIGSNGAGKSTLLKLLVGLVQHSSGQASISGTPINQKNLNIIRSKVGYAFQDADAQLFMPTVYEDVAFGPRNSGLEGQALRNLVEASLNEVGAYHLKDRPPYKLSGGEKRAVTLATVLSMKPEIIVLDEPATGLDPKSRRNLIRVLRGIEQTKILATHDMEMALELCDKIIVMHEGRVMAQGPCKDIFSDIELLSTCHIERPYSMRVCCKCGK